MRFEIPLKSRLILARKFAVIFAFAALAFLLFAVSAQAQSLPGFQAPLKPQIAEEPLTVRAARGAAPLAHLYSHLKVKETKVKRLGALTGAEMQRRQDKFRQIGIVRQLQHPIDPLLESAVYSALEGEVRVTGVDSREAAAVRVQFGGMSLPAGARVFVYSMSNSEEFYGPYEGHGLSDDGTFWTPPMTGSGAVIEYFAPAGTSSSSPPFRVLAVGHVYKETVTIDAAGACENEVTPEWSNVASSVGRIDFVSGSFLGSCTGTLLNNQANDQTPYFLTANHCINNNNQAISVTVYWNYNSGDTPPPGTPRTNGATLLATGFTSDFTLLRLVNDLPGGLFFSGWDATNVTSPKPVTGIHHPQASHKRISFGSAGQPNSGECASGDQCLRVDWSSGVTEVGSSGSGIWIGGPGDPGGPKLIGTLTGGHSGCGVAPANQWDVYGRFSLTYPNIAGYLSGSCVTGFSPTNQNIPSSGGTGTITVTAPGECRWTAVSSESFVTITSAAQGQGNGSISFSVAPHDGYQRSAKIMIGTQVFTINQASGGLCAPTPMNIGQTINGVLTTSSCMRPNGIVEDSYTFNVIGFQEISILMTSNQFDAYLVLRNAQGLALYSNDTFGSGTDARIPGTGYFSLGPGTYTIVASSLFAANHATKPGVGAYSLTLSERPTQTLTITSSGLSNVPITVVYPIDRMGLGNGNTDFTRVFYQGYNVTLDALNVFGGYYFRKWQLDGVDFSTNVSVSVPMNADHTITAVYSPPAKYSITVGSSNPNSGVTISAPIDSNGQGDGVTQFTRSYNESSNVTMTAPLTAANGNVFRRWQKDGVDFSTNNTIQVFMNGNVALTAVYDLPATVTVTVTSQTPGSGVNVEVSPNDKAGLGGGTTQFVRTYNENSVITFTAPATVNGNTFVRWRRNFSNWVNTLSTTITVGFNTTMTAVYAPPPPVIQLSQSSYTVSESAGVASINVMRSGDVSSPVTVKYTTSDATDVNFNCNPNTAGQISGAASRKCDYHIAAGRLRFAAGETSKTIMLSLVNDVYAEPAESFTITLSNPTGPGLSTPSTATITITDDDTPGQANPIDSTAFYVRMLYVDLLSREPEPAGLAGWVHRIDFCGQPGEPPPPCDRVTVGGDGFLRSGEFFDREFFVIRLYRTAFGRIPRYDEVGDFAYVSGFLSDADLELSKQEVITDMMARAEFLSAYNSLNTSQYVDVLIQTAGVTLPGGVRDFWVNALNGSTKTRPQVFRELSERPEVSAKYLNEARVVSCYYGFFTRNPDGAYLNFLERLDRGEINLGDLANAFINAAEYRQRFGP